MYIILQFIINDNMIIYFVIKKIKCVNYIYKYMYLYRIIKQINRKAIN